MMFTKSQLQYKYDNEYYPYIAKVYTPNIGNDPVASVYINHILADDLRYLSTNPEPPEIGSNHSTLVLLVGQTPDPLLLSSCYWNPQDIILILNSSYMSEDENNYCIPNLPGNQVLDRYFHYFAAIKNLNNNNLLYNLQLDKIKSNSKILDNDSPAAVFAALSEVLRDKSQAIIDITGAKKSMVAGAFLYAAFGQHPISYVDYEDTTSADDDAKAFNTTYGRPYGFSCMVRVLSNPYSLFALRDWQKIKTAYENRQFKEARLTLQEILSGLSSGANPYFRQMIASSDDILKAFTCLEHWDNGEYRKAYTILNKINNAKTKDFPQAVVELGARGWPDMDDSEKISDENEEYRKFQIGDDSLLRKILSVKKSLVEQLPFLFNSTLVAHYGVDEFKRIENLLHVKEDWRAAFLRSAALIETLLRSRYSICWHKGLVEFLDNNDEIIDFTKCQLDEIVAIFKTDIKYSSFRPLWNTLALGYNEDEGLYSIDQTGQFKLKTKNPRSKKTCHGFCTFQIRVNLEDEKRNALRQIDSNLGKNLLTNEQIFEIRNKAIHSFLSPNKSIAEQAAHLAEIHVRLYMQHETVTLQIHERLYPNWPDFCKSFGMDQFLPAKLLS